MNITLPLRNYGVGGENTYTTSKTRMRRDGICLILVDAWDWHINSTYLEAVMENQNAMLRPLLATCRSGGIPIIHTPSLGTPSAIAKPLPGETIIDPALLDYFTVRDALDAHLQSLRVPAHTLLFAGYSSNFCLLRAMIFMRTVMADSGGSKYRTILIRDCTVALETPESAPGRWCNYVAINMMEQQWGSSITLAELQKALGEHTS